MMRKYLLILSLLISAAGMAQAPNYLYGKDIIITTRDTSSAELTIRNTTRNVLGYFKNIGGGKGQYTLIPQTDIIALPDSLLARYTKTQSDARYKSISYVPDWLEITGTVPTWNQNTTGTAGSLSAVLSSSLGGAGSVNGLLKANGSGLVTAASAADIPSLSSYYLPLSGGTLTGSLSGTASSFSGNSNADDYSMAAWKFIDWGGVVAQIGGIQSSQWQELYFYTNGVVRQSLSNTQSTFNVPIIGTTLSMSGGGSFGDNILITAGKKLQFSSTAYMTPENNVTGAEISTPGIFTLKTGGVENFRLNGDGTSLYNNNLTISASDQSNARFITTNTGTSGRSYAILAGYPNVDNTGFSIHDITSNITRFRIDNSGAATLSGSIAATSATLSGGVSAGGQLQSQSSLLILKDGSNTISSGGFMAISNAANSRQHIWQLDASNDLLWGYYNGSGYAQTYKLTGSGAGLYSSSVTASSFIKSGGTSSQFLMADGSTKISLTSSLDTGRAAAQIITGGSLNKVRDSIVNLIPTSTPTAGYYTPTISSTVNVTSSTMNECRWTRIGDIVTVSGSVLILPTTISSSVGFQITLPIDTEHPSIYELSGVGSATELSINKLVNITGLTSSNTAAFNYVASQNSASDVVSFMFTYKVIPL
jgi:hypothetical protein